VIRVSELNPAEAVERELAVIKVNADRDSRSRDNAGRKHLQGEDNFFRCIRQVDDIEVTGDETKVDAIGADAQAVSGSRRWPEPERSP